ncbi:MAG: DCC1-like thiol-disulfide oxidoreductase family protein [Pseudomonadota bacterium]
MIGMGDLTVLYNNVCPVCREGICAFERRTKTGPEGVVYFDLSTSPQAFDEKGVSLNDVRRKLHAITADGAVLRGWPAIAALWKHTPRFGWLAALGSMPGLNWGARALYHVTAQILWWWNRASGRW